MGEINEFMEGKMEEEGAINKSDAKEKYSFFVRIPGELVKLENSWTRNHALE